MALKFRRPCNDEDVEKLVEIFTTREKKSASKGTISESTRKKIYYCLDAVYGDLES